MEEVMINQFGRSVPISRVRPQDKLQDQVVRDLVASAEKLREQIAAFKAQAFSDVRAYMQIIAEKYGARIGGTRGGLQIDSYDGLMRINISVADTIELGPEVQAARSLIDECLTRWSEGANGNLKVVVDDAFKVGEGGKLAIDRILGLRRIEIDDPTWQQAMVAINDAIKPTSSRAYLRIYVRPNNDAKFEQLVLDFAKL